MELMTITVSLYDGSRRARVLLPVELPVSALMAQCTARWSLPVASFVFRLAGSGVQLPEWESLGLAGVRDRCELEVFPVLEGG